MAEELSAGFEVGEVVTLTDDDGENMLDFRIMYIFDIEDRNYLVLVPLEQEDQEEYEVHFLRYDGDDMLHQIEDEQERTQVLETFEILMAEVENGEA